MKVGTYKEVQFGDRIVRVMRWLGRGLAVVDPERQDGLPPEKVRTWIAHTNLEIALYWAVRDPEPPSSIAQITLTLRGYASFLDPTIERPRALDQAPFDYVPPPEPNTGYGTSFECYNQFPAYDDWYEEISKGGY